LYIIEGAISLFLGLIALVTLPDFPHSKTGSQKWLLSDYELQVASERIAGDRIQQQEQSSIWLGFKSACLDYRTWFFVSAAIKTHTCEACIVTDFT